MDTVEATPELGRFLAIAIPIEAPAEALAAFAGLGFRDVPVNDLEAAPRAVVSDGRLSIGLFDPGSEGPVPVFVRPDLRRHVAKLEAAGIELAEADLADDRFHRVVLRDPSDVEIVLIEARTFAPVDPDPSLVSACGRFAELCIATRSIEDSKRFWTTLGFAVADETTSPYPCVRLEGFGLAIGLHETTAFRAGLCFDAPQLDARIEYLRAKGYAVQRSSPLGPTSATLHAPGGVPFFLRGDESNDAER
ncbi:MAG: hypothetical protein LOD94_08815 [Gammaproteobacteria bacterium]|nr:hypothetical protein [Gammaproteobacteria bacterium]